MHPVKKWPKLIKIYFLLKYKNLPKKKKKIRTISKVFSLSKWIIWSLSDVGKQIFFKGCKENFQQIVGWKVKLLYRAGRLPLIKSILSSILLYPHACFNVSKSVCSILKTYNLCIFVISFPSIYHMYHIINAS